MIDSAGNLTNSKKCDTNSKVQLTKAQAAFIEYCAEFGWGKVEVIIKNGEPVMVSPIKQDIKLD